MKYILGSGLIGFLAKAIHPEYQIIPVGKSRYYRHNVATCDDYIICHKDIDHIVQRLGDSTVPILFKRAISFAGQVVFGKHFLPNYIAKLYNNQPHPSASIATWIDGFIYNTSCTKIFSKLESQMLQTCREFIMTQDKVVSIDSENRIIHTKHKSLSYDRIISTVPLNHLLDLLAVPHELKSLDLHTFVVETNDLDFEGASELLVADDDIEFHKCTYLRDNKYQFFSVKEIANLQTYLSLFMSKYNILSGTCVPEAIPIGDPREYTIPDSILCVGSNAQWDDNMDVSSSIRRLVRQ